MITEYYIINTIINLILKWNTYLVIIFNGVTELSVAEYMF